MRKFYLSLIALAACVCSLTAAEHRADYNVIPLPKKVAVDDAHVFTLQPGMGIAYDANNEEVCRNARFLRDWVEEMTGIELLLTPDDYKAAVKLTLGISTKKGESTGGLTPQQEEAYVIIVDKKGVTIQAHNPVGFFRAAQTLRKSLPVVKDGMKAVNLWTEHVKYPAHAFYQLLPRIGASSEVQWCLPEQKDFENFKERLPHLKEIYEVLGVPYCKLLE